MMEFGYRAGRRRAARRRACWLEIVNVLKDLQGHERTLVAALPTSRAAL